MALRLVRSGDGGSGTTAQREDTEAYPFGETPLVVTFAARDDLGATKAGAHWGSGLPVTLLVDAQGAVVFEQHGAFADVQQIRDLVATQLKVAS